MPKNLGQRFTEMLDETVTKNEVSSLFKQLFDFVKEAKTRLEGLFSAHEAKMHKMHEQMSSEQTEANKAVSGRVDNLKETFYSEMRTTMRHIDEKVKEVESKIPTATDLEPLKEEIAQAMEDMHALIPNLPEELSAEGVRDKLENLEGDERLDASAVKGLEEYVRSLNLGGETKVIGHVQTFASSIIPAAETPDGVVTAFTFATKPAVVVVNGSSYREDKGWTYTSNQVVLDFAPPTGSDVYGLM